MQDNVSVLIATIVAVVIIVLFPIYNVATRQDSIANNMVVRATTNFVDEVRNKGYIDKESYGKYLNELDKTGNTYDIEMEVYKPILLETAESTNEYEPKYEIDYTNKIMSDIENTMLYKDEGSVKKENVYYLYDEYKFYVRVKNNNVTQAQILFDRLLSGKQDERIVVNYGGIVYSNEWKQGEAIITNSTNISITRPLDSSMKEFKYEYITDIYDQYLDETKTIYGIAVRLSDEIEGGNVINFVLKYKGVEKLPYDLKESRERHIKDYIETDGFVVNDDDIVVKEMLDPVENSDGTYSYEYLITLTNINYDFENNPFMEGRVRIKSGSAYTNSGPLTELNSKDFIIFYEPTELEIEAEALYFDDAGQPIIGTGRADYATIKVKLSKADSNITQVRYVKGEYTEQDFAANPDLGISIKDKFNSVDKVYITSNDEGERITENGKYTIYAKDKFGKEKVLVLDVIGLGSDRIKVVLNWKIKNDFDMHLLGIKDDITKMHVYYQSKRHDSAEVGHAHLNQDNTSGGENESDSEIIILERAARDMKYNIYIYSYTSKYNSFFIHQPVLTVYRGEEGKEVKIYDSTTDKTWTENGSCRYWDILTYDANTRTIEFIDKYR